MAAPPDPLPLDVLGDALGQAATVLRANAMSAGLDAPVPTCPGWTVRDLVAHQGMVHRWAASHLGGAPIERADTESLERQGLSSPDILGWFDDGANKLLQAIVDAPDDLDALAFLENTHSPKHFWTRRQCHETTIHAVDALAARLGRPPRHDETWISRTIALDGIDELLRGFVTRPRMRINPAEVTTVLVAPDDTDDARDCTDAGWRLVMRPDHPVEATVVTQASHGDSGEPTGGGAPRVSASDRVLDGNSVEIYLRLWNRGTNIDPWWRDLVTVNWR